MPASKDLSRHGATVVFRLAYLSARGRTGPAGSTGADHVFKRDGEPEPSRERVDGMADEQPPARGVGALLELKGDTHRLPLFHTGSIAGGGGGPRHGVTVVFCFFRPPWLTGWYGRRGAQRGGQLSTGADG